MSTTTTPAALRKAARADPGGSVQPEIAQLKHGGHPASPGTGILWTKKESKNRTGLRRRAAVTGGHLAAGAETTTHSAATAEAGAAAGAPEIAGNPSSFQSPRRFSRRDGRTLVVTSSAISSARRRDLLLGPQREARETTRTVAPSTRGFPSSAPRSQDTTLRGTQPPSHDNTTSSASRWWWDLPPYSTHRNTTNNTTMPSPSHTWINLQANASSRINGTWQRPDGNTTTTIINNNTSNINKYTDSSSPSDSSVLSAFGFFVGMAVLFTLLFLVPLVLTYKVQQQRRPPPPDRRTARRGPAAAAPKMPSSLRYDCIESWIVSKVVEPHDAVCDHVQQYLLQKWEQEQVLAEKEVAEEEEEDDEAGEGSDHVDPTALTRPASTTASFWRSTGALEKKKGGRAGRHRTMSVDTVLTRSTNDDDDDEEEEDSEEAPSRDSEDPTEADPVVVEASGQPDGNWLSDPNDRYTHGDPHEPHFTMASSPEKPPSEAPDDEEEIFPVPDLMDQDLLQMIMRPPVEECSICFDEFRVGDIVSWSARPSSCPHVFHHACIKEWLWRRTGCPYCREEYFPVPIHLLMSWQEQRQKEESPQPDDEAAWMPPISTANKHYRAIKAAQEHQARDCFYCAEHGLMVVPPELLPPKEDLERPDRPTVALEESSEGSYPLPEKETPWMELLRQRARSVPDRPVLKLLRPCETENASDDIPAETTVPREHRDDTILGMMLEPSSRVTTGGPQPTTTLAAPEEDHQTALAANRTILVVVDDDDLSHLDRFNGIP